MKEISISGKILSVALGLISWMVILAGMFIASSEDTFAATSYPLYVGGVQFESDNLVIDRNDNADFSGKAEYDPTTNTLTLNNFNNGGWTYTFTQGGHGESYGIYYNGNDNLNIVLVGDNTITCNLTGNESATFYNKSGLTSEGNATVTITGDSLTVESGDTPSVGALPTLAGISVKKKLVINSGRITARGGDCYLMYSYGILVGYSENEGEGILEVYDGYVKAEAGNVTGDHASAESYGIHALDRVTVNGGVVEATGGNTYNGMSKGIYSKNTLFFNGGQTIAKAGESRLATSYGISSGYARVSVDAFFIASGNTKAAYHFIYHSVPGFGWDNVDGTGTRNAIPANPSGQAYNYKKLRFPDKYLVTVINGSGGGFYNENDTVTVTADPPEKGKVFFKWERDDGMVLADERAETTTFTMPARELTVTAIYKDAEDNDDSESILVDKVPLTGSNKYASSNDNFAPVADNGKINKMKLDFSNVARSDVKPTDLKMTVIKGSKFTTDQKLQDASGASGGGGVKVKVNNKTLIPTISCKSDGSATFTMDDGVTYTVNFTVQKPKADKSMKKMQVASEGAAPVIRSIKEMFGTDIDSGDLKVTKGSHATASGNVVVIDPTAKDSMKIEYQYINKKYKLNIKIK